LPAIIIKPVIFPKNWVSVINAAWVKINYLAFKIGWRIYFIEQVACRSIVANRSCGHAGLVAWLGLI